ncbi:hypothetical protein N7517_001188 [Penicillium concentricum]|uniref:Uncharacterized protein n=1 Tax=Penicillium concentricum TaxID=293559 RepID=A0A9W9VIL4_9EURO|nr:uncharacterized protein N7517_001188 [Penicillium concentricum]KAJ5383277.1 hypothetical protein N7517_001188 [Penicillium concentricum]
MRGSKGRAVESHNHLTPCLMAYGSGLGLRWITVKLSDGDRHCDADLMRMVIERLQDEEVVVNSEYTS